MDIDKMSDANDDGQTKIKNENLATTNYLGKVEAKSIFSLLPAPPRKIPTVGTLSGKKKRVFKSNFKERQKLMWETKLNTEQRNAWNKLSEDLKYSYLFPKKIKTKKTHKIRVKKNNKNWWKDNLTDWYVT